MEKTPEIMQEKKTKQTDDWFTAKEGENFGIVFPPTFELKSELDNASYVDIQIVSDRPEIITANDGRKFEILHVLDGNKNAFVLFISGKSLNREFRKLGFSLDGHLAGQIVRIKRYSYVHTTYGPTTGYNVDALHAFPI